MRSSSPPSLRTHDTARPRSAARLRAAPMLPPPPLSVVERHAIDGLPCQASACEAVAAVTARVPAYGMSVVVMLCRACAKKLPGSIRPVPIAQGGR